MTGDDELRLPAVIGSLPRLMDRVAERARTLGMPPERILDVQLAVEEALVNVIRYAYPGGGGEVEVRCGEGREGGLSVEIWDSGVPFDPTAAADPDVTLGLEERPVGGLGIYLMKKVAESVDYRREDGRNVLRLVIR